MTNRKFVYDVGDIVKSIEIIDRKIVDKRRVYSVRCCNDGYEYDIKQSDLFEALKLGTTRCPVCANRIIIDGVNSLADKSPELAEWFVDKKLPHKIPRFLNKEVELECPNCHRRFWMRPQNIKTVPSCICGDGFSYPEKMFSNILNELKVDYIYQLCNKNFEWCSSYKYDFYFIHNDTPYIFELDGGLGHGHKDIKNRDSAAVDREKDNLAKINGILLYRIDVNYPDVGSRFEYIKDNICASCLGDMFDLNIVNWDVIRKKSEKSLMIDVCKDFNNGQTYIKALSDKYHISTDTIRRYLKTGTQLDLCCYDSSMGFKHYRYNYYDEDNNPNKKVIKVTYQNEAHYINGINGAPVKIKKLFDIDITYRTIFRHLSNQNIKSRKGLTFSYATEEEIEKLKEVI